MEKRRVFGSLLAAVLAVGILAGCGSNSPAPTSTKPSGSGSAPDTVGVSTDPESLTHEELIQRSDEIVIGSVTEISDGYQLSGDSSVYTDYHIKVSNVLRGADESDNLTIRLSGGETGTLVMDADGEAKLEQGKLFLLFLQRAETEEDCYTVIGAWQGAFALSDKGMPVTPDVQVLTDGETTDITCVNSYNETETWALQDVRDNIHALSEDGGNEG